MSLRASCSSRLLRLRQCPGKISVLLIMLVSGYSAHEDHESVIRIARKCLQVWFCGHPLSRSYKIPKFAQRGQIASVIENSGMAQRGQTASVMRTADRCRERRQLACYTLSASRRNIWTQRYARNLCRFLGSRSVGGARYKS